MARVHIAFFSNGYPYVDAAIWAMDLSHRHGASFSRSIGQPYSFRRRRLLQWLMAADGSVTM